MSTTLNREDGALPWLMLTGMLYASRCFGWCRRSLCVSGTTMDVQVCNTRLPSTCVFQALVDSAHVPRPSGPGLSVTACLCARWRRACLETRIFSSPGSVHVPDGVFSVVGARRRVSCVTRTFARFCEVVLSRRGACKELDPVSPSFPRSFVLTARICLTCAALLLHLFRFVAQHWLSLLVRDFAPYFHSVSLRRVQIHAE